MSTLAAPPGNPKIIGAPKIRVLVVDDSAIVRRIISDVIAAEPDMEVAGTAPDPYVARDKILALKPDVLTLDIEMPRMDGLTFLKKLMHYHPLPVVIISSLGQKGCETSLEAMRLGAVDVLGKPGGPYSVGELSISLTSKIRAAAVANVAARVRARAPQPAPASDPSSHLPPRRTAIARAFPAGSMIAIGASAGGTEAIQYVLERLPRELPPITITQHIPAGFSRAFADRLNRICGAGGGMQVREACDGDNLESGLALIAPGNYHMLIRKFGAGYRVHLDSGPRVCYQRPAVDVMFESIADAAGTRALGVILTGMGSDGAQGLLRMRHSGSHTIAQDEASCLVYGMPKEAVRMGAVDTILPLADIPDAIVRSVSSTNKP